jgi:hypothetical protein
LVLTVKKKNSGKANKLAKFTWLIWPLGVTRLLFIIQSHLFGVGSYGVEILVVAITPLAYVWIG